MTVGACSWPHHGILIPQLDRTYRGSINIFSASLHLPMSQVHNPLNKRRLQPSISVKENLVLLPHSGRMVNGYGISIRSQQSLARHLPNLTRRV